MFLYFLLSCTSAPDEILVASEEDSTFYQPRKVNIEPQKVYLKEYTHIHNNILTQLLDASDEWCDNAFNCHFETDKQKKGLTVESEIKGHYSVGPYFGGLSTLISMLMYNMLKRMSPFGGQDELKFNDYIEIWFGLALFLPYKDGDLYTQVNVEALKNIKPFLPKPSDTWQGITYQVVYESLFKEFAHNISIGFVHVQSLDVDKATKEYIALAQQDFDEGLQDYEAGASPPWKHLLKTYQNAFPDEVKQNTPMVKDREHLTWLSPQISIGFWLRRHADGSARELWNICLGLLKEYDPKWIKRLRSQYPHVDNIWNTPVSITTEKHIFDPNNRGFVFLENIDTSFETWLDGKKVVHHPRYIVTTVGMHTITSSKCMPSEKNQTDTLLCKCNIFNVDIQPRETVKLSYSAKNAKPCDTTAKVITP